MAKKNRKKFGSFESPELRNASKTLLANIRFASLDEPVKTIMVTSTIMDEGKSTVASNLACAMASSGLRVLIVDLDMRRRSLGAMMGLHGTNGIYSVLSGQVPLNQAITSTKIQNLYFLDCERDIASPPDILSSKRFGMLVQHLKKSFDYVVFDTPPAGLFPDAAIISVYMDGCLVALRCGHAKRKDVAETIKKLRAAEANILGTVLTFAEEEESDSYYYYYNSDGKKSKKRKKGEEVESIVTTSREFVQNDASAWAQSVGVRVNSAEVENPYAPGAFKKSAGKGAGGRHTSAKR